MTLKLIANRIERLRQDRQVVIVLVAGGSASGKTTLATRLGEELGDEALILTLDDYCRGKGFRDLARSRGRALTWDHPGMYDTALAARHLSKLASGKAVEVPRYSHRTGLVEGNQCVNPRPVIILEGLYALRTALRPLGQLKVYVDRSYEGRLARRLARDPERTGWSEEKIRRFFDETVEPLHRRYVEPTRRYADLIVSA